MKTKRHSHKGLLRWQEAGGRGVDAIMEKGESGDEMSEGDVRLVWQGCNA